MKYNYNRKFKHNFGLVLSKTWKIRKSFQATVNDLRLTNLKSLMKNGLN